MKKLDRKTMDLRDLYIPSHERDVDEDQTEECPPEGPIPLVWAFDVTLWPQPTEVMGAGSRWDGPSENQR